MPTPTSARVFVEHSDHGHGGDYRHDLLGLRGRAAAALSAVSGELRAHTLYADDHFRGLCGEPPCRDGPWLTLLLLMLEAVSTNLVPPSA
jgi:hypothetical protein